MLKSGVQQPVGRKKSKRKMIWARTDFASFRLTAKYLLTPLHAFQVNGCSIGAGEREDMHWPDHFAADFFVSDGLPDHMGG